MKFLVQPAFTQAANTTIIAFVIGAQHFYNRKGRGKYKWVKINVIQSLFKLVPFISLSLTNPVIVM